ncbi:TonB-dependent receptor [Marivirga lumbricoides]|uniref:TonB-dependent receptor n=1 Tax=Marivirga lumbricoides TaxID=1046115 RepID=A0ABQ1N8N2_9BACT|nr:TonB-dependent receptor [Marivirga lumbricoides]
MKYSFIILFIVISFHVYAQNQRYTISGTVKNKSEEVLIGATIQIKELNIGDIANENGHYEISNLKNGIYQLQVTSVGYEAITRTVSLSDSNLIIDFLLKPSSLELKEVRVEASPFKSGPTEQSMTIETIERDFLDKNNSNTFVNTLQRIPGINAINTGVGIAKPVIRGLSFNRIIVNDRGIKQEGQQWGADHGLEIDQYEPERVEIIKGPSSLLYGSDGLGGVINILAPSFPVKNTLGGNILSTFKSNNNLVGTSTMIEGNKNGKVFRLRFSTQDFADYKVPADSFTYNRFVLPIYNQRLKNTAGNERNMSAMFGLAKEWGHVSITISNFHQKAGFFTGALGIPREYQLTSDGDSRNIDVPRQVTNHFKIIANANILVNKDWLEVDLGYQNNYRREESSPHAHGKGPRPEGQLALGLTLQTISANIKYHHQINKKLSSIYGFQGQYQQNKRSGFEFLLSDFKSGNAGLFIYQEYALNKIITINGGLRVDNGLRDIERFLDPIYSDPETISGYNERTGEVKRNFSNFSGATGISFYPNHHFNAKLNVGSSFRMPSAPELSSNGIHHGTFRHEYGDSTLNTERGWQVDLNLTYHTEGFHASLTPFYNYFKHFIYLSPTAQFSTLPEGGQVYRYTQDNAIFAGGEATIEYHFIKALHIKTGLEYIWNYNMNNNLALPFTPPFSILGEVEYKLPFKYTYFNNMFVGILTHYFADQNRVDRNEKPTPGYTLLNFSTGWDINIKNTALKFIFTVQNLADVQYMNHLSRYRLLNLPEQGRNFNITLKLPFTIIGKK